MNRRTLLQTGGATALGAMLDHARTHAAQATSLTANGRPPPPEWLDTMTDPFRDVLLKGGTGGDFPERVKACAPPMRDKPAFDPKEVARLAAAIRLPVAAKFEHAMLERVVRVGLAHIDLTFQRDHPTYGIGKYAWAACDGFPPVIIATVDALTLWDNVARAEQLMSYWLRCFIHREGYIMFQGPSLSEYGQVLTTVRLLVERGANADWLAAHRDIVRKMVAWIEVQMLADGGVVLVKGMPEDDRRQDIATYFHNNAWLVRGLRDWAALDAENAESLRRHADALLEKLLEAIQARWPADPADWWLPPCVETTLPVAGEIVKPAFVTENKTSTYTNYRYWLELLSSGALPRALAERIVHARLHGGGQFLGMTRLYRGLLDDWPLHHWLDSLWQLGQHDDFKLSLWGHILFHQAEDHLTAYEVVSMPPGRHSTPYCLPSQLVGVRGAAKLAFAP